MRVILIGASGTIGKEITSILANDNVEIVPVSRNSENLQVNIESEDSIRNLFGKAGAFDGLICAAGSAYAGPLEKMRTEDAYKGIRSKLMGQVNLVLIGQQFINPGGFFTLTSGVLAEEGNDNSAGLGLVNGAINGFVINAAVDMRNGTRINVVSPSIISESVAIYGEPKLREPIPASEVARAYQRTVTEHINGQVLKAFGKLRSDNKAGDLNL